LKISMKFGLLVLFLAVSSCTKLDDDESAATPGEEYPDQESWNAKMFFTRDGKRQAVLLAGYVAKYSGKRYTLLKEGVRVDFYDSEGKVKSVLTSREGKVLDDTQDMVATGSVEMISSNGTHLTSDELWWDNKLAKVHSKVPVRITTPTDTLYGDTFQSDPDLINYDITNPRGSSQKTIIINE
jgi:LPS export ABC transporter protein LptC